MIIQELPGYVIAHVSGKDVKSIFENETGGFRFQRSVKKGNVHSSTITIAVFEEGKQEKFKIDEKDVIEDPYKGSGKGGQNRNKRLSAIRLTRKKTNLQFSKNTKAEYGS